MNIVGMPPLDLVPSAQNRENILSQTVGRLPKVLCFGYVELNGPHLLIAHPNDRKSRGLMEMLAALSLDLGLWAAVEPEFVELMCPEETIRKSSEIVLFCETYQIVFCWCGLRHALIVVCERDVAIGPILANVRVAAKNIQNV